MRLTNLVESLGGDRQRCDVCQWHCELGPGDLGRCLVRIGSPEGIAVLNDGLISAANVGPIEDHRLWHFFPRTQALAIGGWGYAFPADQQRGQHGQIPEDQRKRRHLDPDRIAAVALERLCRGVIWAYSDPSVSQEYVLEMLQLCRANSRYTALVTSGYLTIAALDQLGHYLDGMNLELRAFDDAAYKRLGGVDHWRGILEVAGQAHQRWGCHIEVTTRLHPGVNDAHEQLQGMATWMRDTLGTHTPWHILPGDAGAAAVAAVARARRIGHEAGLHFVYGPEPGQSTTCFSCNRVAIERGDGVADSLALDGSRCASCGTDLYIRTSIFKR